MKNVSKDSDEAGSAFARRLTELSDKTAKKDSGAVLDRNAASWFEHIVSANADGEVCAEAFVLVVAPDGRYGEGQEKWDAISESVRRLLGDGREVQQMERGHTRSYPNPSEKSIDFPTLDETVPNNRTPKIPGSKTPDRR